MRIFSKSISRQAQVSLPGVDAEPGNVLFLDLATTGIKRADCRVYMIGCICMQHDGWELTQWFDDTGLDEKRILSSFLIYCSRFRYVINYNGNRFDLPFLRARIEVHGMQDMASSFLSMSSIDLYGYIAPYRHLLGLADYRQQTLEQALQTGRTENRDGKEMIELYKKYLALPSSTLLDQLTAWNEADVSGLLDLLPLAQFTHLEEMKADVRKAQANYFTDHEGNPAEELLIQFAIPFTLPVRIYAGLDHCYLKIDGETGVLKIPLYTEEMKYFYANYRDYYYLPGEDMAIHKYIASYVDKNRRVQARPETCYTRKQSSYLPQWGLYCTPFFKRRYEDKEIFFEFSEKFRKDREALSDYASYVLRHIIFPKKGGTGRPQ